MHFSSFKGICQLHGQPTENFRYFSTCYLEFYADVIANHGEEIVKISKATAGYFDITFGSGLTLHAISGQSITLKPV